MAQGWMLLGLLAGCVLSTKLWALAKTCASLTVWPHLGRKRAAQRKAESNPEIAGDFAEGSLLPRRAWIPSRPVMLMFTLGLIVIATGIFTVLSDVFFWAFGLTEYLTVEDKRDWVIPLVLTLWLGVLWAVMDLVQRKVMDGCIFPNYGTLLAHVRACKTSKEVLSYAPSLRYAAKMHIRGPHDLYRIWRAWRDDEDRSVYYRTERLADLLLLLEQRFPFTSEDERFRKRYWAYGRSIYRVLLCRDPNLVRGSLFGQQREPPKQGQNIVRPWQSAGITWASQNPDHKEGPGRLN